MVWVIVSALLGSRTRGQGLRADCRMRVERFEFLVLGQFGDHSVRRSERVLVLGQFLDESRAPFEELCELVDS